MENHHEELTVDTATLAAIAIIAWALASLLHEAVGHGLPAILMGIPVRAVSSTTVFIQWDQIETIGQNRIIHIGGTLINFITGGIALWMLNDRRPKSHSMRYFLWLFSTMSLVIVIMYMVSAIAIGAGDWTQVLLDLEPPSLGLALVIGTGILFILPGYVWPMKAFLPDLRGKRWLLLKLTGVPVLALIIAQTLSVLLSPFAFYPPGGGHVLAMIFVFLHFIVWVIVVNLIPRPRSVEPIEHLELKRSTTWLVVGLVTLLVFVLVFGPGLGPMEQDPRLG